MSQKPDNPGFGTLDTPMVRWSPFWRARSRSNYLICNIDVIALASVVLVLLFIFMCRPIDHHGSPVDLAQVDNPISMRAADREDAMLIAVTRDNKVYFGRGAILRSELPDKIRTSVARGSERKVYIKADARAKYGWVAEAVERVHEAGIEKIGFLVEQRKAPPVAASR